MKWRSNCFVRLPCLPGKRKRSSFGDIGPILAGVYAQMNVRYDWFLLRVSEVGLRVLLNEKHL